MTDRFFTNAVPAAGSIVGTERIPADLPGGGSVYLTPAQIEAYAAAIIVPLAVTATESALAALRSATDQYTTDASTAGFTASAAEVALPCNTVSNIGTVVLDLTGALAGAASIQLPTVASVLTLLVNGYVGQTWILRIINNSSAAFGWTVTTNTGWNLAGTVTVAQNTFRDFLVTVSNVSGHTASLQNIGSGGN